MITFENLRITGGNSTEGGGGINLAATKVKLINTTVSGNYSVGAGGGISTGNLILENSTVSGNISLNGAGGGIHASTVDMTNSTAPSTTVAVTPSVMTSPTNGSTGHWHHTWLVYQWTAGETGVTTPLQSYGSALLA